MVMISESLKQRLERLTMKATLELLTRVDPLLSTANELLLSTLAWIETYSWYLEISLDELDSPQVKEEPVDSPPNPTLFTTGIDWNDINWDDMQAWTPLDD
jgi:hypothetical protein